MPRRRRWIQLEDPGQHALGITGVNFADPLRLDPVLGEITAAAVMEDQLLRRPAHRRQRGGDLQHASGEVARIRDLALGGVVPRAELSS